MCTHHISLESLVPKFQYILLCRTHGLLLRLRLDEALLLLIDLVIHPIQTIIQVCFGFSFGYLILMSYTEENRRT